MSGLAEFLLARLSEDEVAARQAIDPDRPGTHWRWFDYDTDRPLVPEDFQQDGGYTAAYLATTEEFPTTSGVGPLPAFALSRVEELEGAGPHIARWDPSRVLAECEARRRIVKIQQTVQREFPGDDAAGMTLRLLALPYADHPDYDETWQP